MKPFFFVIAITIAATATAFSGFADSYFVKVGTITTGTPDASTANVAVNATGAYVKVSCPDNAYVGVGIGTGTVCLQTDGGLPCDLIRFSSGEKFYVHTLVGQNRATAYMPDAGVQSCGVFEARN